MVPLCILWSVSSLFPFPSITDPSCLNFAVPLKAADSLFHFQSLLFAAFLCIPAAHPTSADIFMSRTTCSWEHRRELLCLFLSSLLFGSAAPPLPSEGQLCVGDWRAEGSVMAHSSKEKKNCNRQHFHSSLVCIVSSWTHQWRFMESFTMTKTWTESFAGPFYYSSPQNNFLDVLQDSHGSAVTQKRGPVFLGEIFMRVELRTEGIFKDLMPLCHYFTEGTHVLALTPFISRPWDICISHEQPKRVCVVSSSGEWSLVQSGRVCSRFDDLFHCQTKSITLPALKMDFTFNKL